ncbi:MAG: type III polyketide synthase, partial [Gramella sp.]|nr:type III polyketide synthase [Christiangramia sp.]
MSVKIVRVEKELPNYSRETHDILPFVEEWLSGQEERFRRKILKIFEGARVDKRYSIMSPEEVFTSTSFEDKNDIYVREVKKMGINVLNKSLDNTQW